jgi:hypothetical protein
VNSPSSPKTCQSKRSSRSPKDCIGLTADLQRHVLEFVLSGDPTEVVVERIHEYLGQVGEQVRSGTVALDDFIIYKVSSSSNWRRVQVILTVPFAASWQESSRLPGCEEPTTRPSRPTHEEQGSECESWRCGSLHFLSWRGRASVFEVCPGRPGAPPR